LLRRSGLFEKATEICGKMFNKELNKFISIILPFENILIMQEDTTRQCFPGIMRQ